MTRLNATHDPKLKSWVESANDPNTDFPIQNLPFGVFTSEGKVSPRVGVAIGDMIVDMMELEQAGLVTPAARPVFDHGAINDFMTLGPEVWSATRARLSELLRADTTILRDNAALRAKVMVRQDRAVMQRPMHVGGYTDFYASKEHATNVGSMFRDPKNALMPNWLHIPIAYNGRANTIVVSGTPIRRPLGQMKPPTAEAPVFGPCKRLDFELEMAAVVGQANPMGATLTVEEADRAIFGYVLLNDWSARDIQAWEYQPLGPFQGKVFASSISPWVVTAEALLPYRVKGPKQEPAPLPYLRQSAGFNHDIALDVAMRAKDGTEETVICRTNFKGMYWSSAQQLAHHAIGGCAMDVGDLLGSGTISGTDKGSLGSLLELSWNGANPLTLAGGAKRTFIEDYDHVVMRGAATGRGHRIGFGQVSGQVLPAASTAKFGA